jgi:sigma-E factor negative regulatory protein RseA
MELESDMSIDSESDPSVLENLSALSDGELDSSAVARACSAWRDDASARAQWHAYQLIGDVMRSDDLASTARHDASFLAALRTRLADEPVVLAPEPVAAPAVPSNPLPATQVANAGRHGRWSWMAPSAVAAGFVLVTGALMVTRAPVPAGAPEQSLLARIGIGGGAGPQVVSAPALTTPGAALTAPVGQARIIRDRRLDRYLEAHQQFAGSSALGVPSGFLRNAAAEANNR